ncbi:MAG: alpha/beta hydrolase, partial [Pseudomonadota bacterium]
MGGRRFSRALHAAPRANAALAFAICMAAALVLAACSPRPSANLLIPVEKPPRFTPKVEMLVATTRAVGDPANPFARVAERSWQINYASHTISIPTRRTPGEIAWPDSYPPDPARHFLSVDQAVLNPASFTAQLRARAAKRDSGKVLVFVHGYNMRYQEAVYWLGQIAHDSGFSGTPILFAWPSAGKAPLYLADRESVAYSRDYFEQFLLAIAALPEVKEIDILAHSMGTWLTVEMLRQASIKGHKDFRGKLAEVILASPDLDVEVFRTQLDTIGRLRKPMTILVSGDDKALGLSRRLNGGNDRVGLIT